MYAVACVALAAVTGWNYQQSKQNVELSDLALENVEALARGWKCTLLSRSRR